MILRGGKASFTFALLFFSSWAFAKVIIIGGGAAGLMAADQLRQQGIEYVLYESQPTVGGRVSSRLDQSELGLYIDEGATLVNSTDKVLLSLIKEFQISMVPRFPHGEDQWMYILNGKVFRQKQLETHLFKKNKKAFEKIARDQKKVIEPFYTNTSIENYFNKIGVDTDFKNLVNAFFLSEYGWSIKDLNLHVLFEYFLVDVKNQKLLFIPFYDEAYTLPRGTGQVIHALAKRNANAIKTNHKVLTVQEKEDHTFEVLLQTPVGKRRDAADQILFAVPLKSLPNLDIQISDLSENVLAEAAASTYGQGMKLHLKFKEGFREKYKFRGILLTDSGEQMWTSSQGQKGKFGLLTILKGPGEPDMDRILNDLEKIAPGVKQLFIGYERTEAPFTYSGAFQPGEPRHLKINSLKSSRWAFIGEASDDEFQGYFEGALRSAKMKTMFLVKKSCKNLLTKGTFK